MPSLAFCTSKADRVARVTLDISRWLRLLARFGYTLVAIAAVACHYDSRMIHPGAARLSAADWTRFNAAMKPSGVVSEVCMLLPSGYRSILGTNKEISITQISTARNMTITGRWIRGDGRIILSNGWSLSRRHQGSVDREQICLRVPNHDGAAYTAVEFRSSDSLTVSGIRWDSHNVFAL